MSLARCSCSCLPTASPEGSPGLRGTAPSWGRPWSCVCSASVPTSPPARRGGRSLCPPRGSAWTRGCWFDGGYSPAVVKGDTEVRTRPGIESHGAGRRRHPRAHPSGGKAPRIGNGNIWEQGINRSSRSEPLRDVPAWQRLHPSRLANPRAQPRGRPSWLAARGACVTRTSSRACCASESRANNDTTRKRAVFLFRFRDTKTKKRFRGNADRTSVFRTRSGTVSDAVRGEEWSTPPLDRHDARKRPSTGRPRPRSGVGAFIDDQRLTRRGKPRDDSGLRKRPESEKRWRGRRARSARLAWSGRVLGEVQK